MASTLVLKGVSSSSALDAPAVTQHGTMTGTPMYMAPELAHGALHISAAADLFSLGVIAFEILTRRPAFAAPAVVGRLAGEPFAMPPPIATLAGGIPRDVAEVLDRCLDPDPQRRPAARHVEDALGAYLRNPFHAWGS